MKKRAYLLLVLLGILALGLTGCGSTKVNLAEFITVTFDGLDGDGEATCSIDTGALWQALSGKPADQMGSLSKQEYERLGWITQFEADLHYDFDVKSGLSNGDRVTVTVTYNEALTDQNKIKITGDKQVFTVEGLADITIVDAFDPKFFNTDTGVVLHRTGIVPYADIWAENKCTNEPESLIKYEFYGTLGEPFKNGDHIKVSATLPPEAKKKGYVLKEREIPFIVDGLDSYAYGLSDFSEASRKEVLEMLNECTNTFFTSETNSIRLFVDPDISDFSDITGYEESIPLPLKGCSFSNLKFQDSQRDKWNEYGFIPFTVDITDSHGEIYHITSGVSISGFLIDENGNLKENPNMGMHVSNQGLLNQP